MDTNITAAIIGASVSVATVLLSNFLMSKNDFRTLQKKEDRTIKLDLLSPLRIYSSELFVRLNSIQLLIKKTPTQECNHLLVQKTSSSMSEWGRDKGCFLLSTCYFYSCFLCYLYKTKSMLSYLHLKKGELEELITLITQATLVFSKNGLYYALQLTISTQMFDESKHQIISYRQFCEKLDDPTELVWFQQLIDRCIALGHNLNDRDEHLIKMIDICEELSEYLDDIIGDCYFLKARKENQ